MTIDTEMKSRDAGEAGLLLQLGGEQRSSDPSDWRLDLVKIIPRPELLSKQKPDQFDQLPTCAYSFYFHSQSFD